MSRRYDRRRKSVGPVMLTIHIILTLATGGLWLGFLLIRALVNNS